MIKESPRVLVNVDLTKSPLNQPVPLHNRWHPDIPAIATVAPNEVFHIQCLDCTGGQIHNNDDPTDMATVDISQVHYLSGPIHV
jgi:formamidase